MAIVSFYEYFLKAGANSEWINPPNLYPYQYCYTYGKIARFCVRACYSSVALTVIALIGTLFNLGMSGTLAIKGKIYRHLDLRRMTQEYLDVGLKDLRIIYLTAIYFVIIIFQVFPLGPNLPFPVVFFPFFPDRFR